jgi:hypothetical protein
LKQACFGRDRAKTRVGANQKKNQKKNSPKKKKKKKKKLRIFCPSLFTLSTDQRSLALFRIAIAIALLDDWWRRCRFTEYFYSDWGVLPRVAHLPDLTFQNDLNIFMMVGTPFGAKVLFVAYLAAILSLLVGYRTRVSTFVCFWFIRCAIKRVRESQTGGEALLCCMMLWGCFANLSGSWSVDRFFEVRRLRESGKEPPAASQGAGWRRDPGGVALQLQILVLYWSSYVWKSGPAWRVDYSASFRAMSIPSYELPLSVFLRSHYELTRFLTA